MATFGLIVTILCCLQNARAAIPYAVGLYITSAYWFTASTSFANPAVTIARSLTDTFAGIAPAGVIAFIVAQVVGGLAGLLVCRSLLLPDRAIGLDSCPDGVPLTNRHNRREEFEFRPREAGLDLLPG